MTGLAGVLAEAWSEVRVHKARVVLSLVGVFLAVFAMTAVTGLGLIVAQVQQEQAERGAGRAATLQVTGYDTATGMPPDPARWTSATERLLARYGITTYATVGYGEALTFVSAILYALHIVGLGAWSTPRDALGMSALQLLVIAVVCWAATIHDGVVLPPTTQDWVSVLYMAVFAGAGALLAQTWAQGHLPPTRAAIVMSMEPVFAAFFAVLLGGESVTVRMVSGGLMVLAAMLVVEALPRRKVEAEVPHIAV